MTKQEVRFNADGRAVEIGDFYVFVTMKETSRYWWGGRKPTEMKLVVTQDKGHEQRYFTGKWWTV